MNRLDNPEINTWTKRRIWIETEIDKADIKLEYDVSDHAIALFLDMQLAFCAGAWFGVVIISISVIDAHFRDIYGLDSHTKTMDILNNYYQGEEISWLRTLRNKYVHNNPDNQFVELDHWFNNKEQLEAQAKKVMKMTISALFQ